MIRRMILLLISAAACLTAQTAAEHLASTEPSQMAWGAYLAAEDGQKDLIPQILPLLKSDNSGVRLAAIDALIRLDADVPEADLVPLLNGYWLDSALIVLSRDPGKHASFLLSLLDRDMDDTQWEALNEILLAAPPPRYATQLLKNWELRFAVCVDGSTCFTGRERVMDGCGISAYILPQIEVAKFPPRYVYVIGAWSTIRSAIVTTVVKKPIRVQYTRFPYTDKPFLSHACVRPPEHDPLPYLARLAAFGTPAADAQPFEWGRIFHWSSPAMFQADAERFLLAARERIERLREALVENRALGGSHPGPAFSVEVRDQRADKTVPLPPIDWKLDR